MASHYSDIGFSTATQDEILQLAIRAAESGSRLSTSLGDYIVWSPGEGAELWVHVVNDDEIMQLHPHYAGTSRMLCCITGMLLDPEYPLEGSISGWAGVTPAQPDIGIYPLTANIPDFRRHFHDVVLPVVMPLQVTAFAQQVIFFLSDEAYATFQATSRLQPRFNLLPPDASAKPRNALFGWLGKLLAVFQGMRKKSTAFDTPPVFIDELPQCGELRLAAESYVPIGGPNGFFTDAPSDVTPAAESVLMSGHIRASQRHTNPETGADFYAMTLCVQEGTFDVVADAQLFTETIPVPGGVLQGTFWLSARVVEDPGEELSA